MLKIFAGMGLLGLLHLAGLALALSLSFVLEGYLFIIFLIGVGLIQIIYVLPLAWWLRRKQQPELLKGVLIGAGLTLLLTCLTGAYFGLFQVSG